MTVEHRAAGLDNVERELANDGQSAVLRAREAAPGHAA